MFLLIHSLGLKWPTQDLARGGLCMLGAGLLIEAGTGARAGVLLETMF